MVEAMMNGSAASGNPHVTAGQPARLKFFTKLRENLSLYNRLDAVLQLMVPKPLLSEYHSSIDKTAPQMSEVPKAEQRKFVLDHPDCLIGAQEGFASIFLARAILEFDRSAPVAAIRNIGESLKTYLNSNPLGSTTDYALCALAVLLKAESPEKELPEKILPAREVNYCGRDLAASAKSLISYIHNLHANEPAAIRTVNVVAVSVLADLHDRGLISVPQVA